MSEDLASKLDLVFEGWRPNPGEKLVGTVVAVTQGNSEYGTYPLLNVMTEDGKPVAVHAFHTVLRGHVEGQKPEPGDRIGIKYIGEKTDGKGQDYHNYNMIVEKGTPEAATKALEETPF